MPLARTVFAQDDSAKRLLILSIGTAAPASIASIAIGLSVPVHRVMEAIYRAPTVLVDGLAADVAQEMGLLLTELGCQVAIESAALPAPAPEPLFDLALHITNAARYGDIVAGLRAFLGTTQTDTEKLVATAPAVILGQVSRATVAALADRLGDGAALIASDPTKARYDLFLGPVDSAVQSRILADLRRHHIPLLADQGCLATGLTRAEADLIWAAHQRSGALRVVNHDFLRFDVVLLEGAATVEALAALSDVTDIPPEVQPRLFGAMPITLSEALPAAALDAVMTRLTGAGMMVRADLVTFQRLGVEITRAGTLTDLSRTLRALGIQAPEAQLRRMPYRLPFHLPELQARIVRDALETTGSVVALFDPTEEAA